MLAPRRESVRRSTLAIAGALLVLVLLTVGLVTGLAHSRAPTSTVAVPSGRASLAIFPFENRTGDTRNDPYCQDGADWVLVDVAKAPGLDVISRDRLLEAAGALQLTFSPCRPVIHAIEIAKQAGARYLLRGATVRMGAVIAVTVEIIEVDTGNVVAPEHEAGLTDKNFTDKLEHLGTQLCQDLQRTH